MSTGNKASPLERFLRIFTVVKPGEGVTALLLALNVFLILMAYYVLKPVREALILAQESAEVKSYLSAAQVVLLAFAVPYYGRLVKTMNRRRLINWVTAFFVGCLVVFYPLGRAGVPLGIIFFLWIGIFNLMIVAQFWAFANDVYTKEEGERLFPIIGFGASLGAVVGSRFAGRFIENVGVYELLLIGGGLLVLEVLLTNAIDRRERHRRRPRLETDATPVPETATRVPEKRGAFGLVFRTRYLLLMAFMLMFLNWVNTTGEYILGSTVRDAALVEMGAANDEAVEKAIGGFYSSYFTYVNIISLVLQLFVVSRVVKYLGVPIAVLILPFISLSAYSIILFYPIITAVLFTKIAENSTDYSLNNTVRNMLFLPCTYEQKFSAKQAIDSFFVRMGDVLSAALVLVGTSLLSLRPRHFAFVNAVLVLVWLVLAWRIGREYKRLSESGRSPSTLS
jgi:AAA family ATP:ADP antiporter